ncbi:unnamed protein product [Choristocarpus tenellus]
MASSNGEGEGGTMDEGNIYSGEVLPQGRKPVKTNFLFKIKRTAEGIIASFKVRLVAQGFTQREGVD